MKKRNIILIIVVIVVIVIGLVCVKLSFRNDQEKESENNASNEVDIYDQEAINEIKAEMNATADTNMYQIEEEYDGRQILQIKPSIQFETVLAGILKDGQPLENEIQDLLKDKPSQKGIWIARQSRDSFLELLKEIKISGFSINEEGYLYVTEENDGEEAKKLREAIQSNRLYIIDVSGTSYTRDEFSGEIIEYPFEKMDPAQAVDVYQEGNISLLEVTTNEKGNLSKQEILKEILLNMQN